MIVFTNTGPIIALSSIGRIDLLPALFGRVCAAASVIEECRVGGAIEVADLRILDWLTVVDRTDSGEPDSPLNALDRGERDTIAAALEARAELVIIDERLGRLAAERMGLRVIGSLGILAKAKSMGLVASFRGATSEMIRAGIRFHPRLIDKVAARVGEA